MEIATVKSSDSIEIVLYLMFWRTRGVPLPSSGVVLAILIQNLDP